MKICKAAIILILLSFSSCTTDGKFDAKTFQQVAGAATNIFNDYDKKQQQQQQEGEAP